MKSALIVFLLLKDGKHQQKRENGGLWYVVAAIPLSLCAERQLYLQSTFHLPEWTYKNPDPISATASREKVD